MNSELNCDRYFLPLVVHLKLDLSIYLWTWNWDLGLRTRACQLYCYRDLKWCARYLYHTLRRGTDCQKIKCYNNWTIRFQLFQKIALRMHYCLLHL